jgi:hypothetical protein
MIEWKTWLIGSVAFLVLVVLPCLLNLRAWTAWRKTPKERSRTLFAGNSLAGLACAGWLPWLVPSFGQRHEQLRVDLLQVGMAMSLVCALSAVVTFLFARQTLRRPSFWGSLITMFSAVLAFISLGD